MLYDRSELILKSCNGLLETEAFETDFRDVMDHLRNLKATVDRE
jgi:hypothetical protein